MTVTPSDPPLIIAHRGSSAEAPENTIAAFTRALRDGADGIEFDVRLARDGVPVVIHDASLRRTAQKPGTVFDYDASDLERIDVGSWFNFQYPELARPEFAQETIPSLERLFKILAHTHGLLYLEMKSDAHQVKALAAAVVRLINEFQFGDRVVVESFDLAALTLLRNLDESIRLAALFEPTLKQPLSIVKGLTMVDLALEVGAAEIALHRSLVGTRVVASANRHGLSTVAWTVDDPKWIDRARSLGIKALITNDPYKMLQARVRSPIQ